MRKMRTTMRILSMVLCICMVLTLIPAVTIPVSAADSWDTNGNGVLEILAIGNSFSVDALEYAWQIAEDLGIEKIVIGNLYIGGCSLKTHATNASGDKAAYTYYYNDNGTWETTSGYKISTALSERNWDYVSLQQRSADSGMESTYNEDLTTLVNYVKRRSRAKLVWHMTWAYQKDCTHSSFPNYNSDQMTMYNSIISVTQKKIAANANFALIIPSGTAVQNSRTSLLGDTITRDGYHMSYDYGRFLTGLMFIKTITGLSVDHITFVPSGVSELQRNIAVESVNNAADTPFAVTESTYDAQSLDEAYYRLSLDLTPCAYWKCTDATKYNKLITDASNSMNFFATARFTRKDIPVGSVIILAEGWKYRADGWVTDARQESRPDVTAEACVVVTEEWWGDYTLRGFNISNSSNTSLKNYMAEDIGKVFQIYVPKAMHEHTYSAVVTPPTCIDGGYTTYTCNDCGESYIADQVEPIEHGYKRLVTAPTCTTKGYTTFFCLNCGHSYVGDEVDVLDHTYECVVSAPTCTADGYTTYTCTTCKDSYVDDVVKTSGHNYESVVTAPTCTSDGYTTHTCTICGNSYESDVVATTGHAYEGVVTAPTCNSDGYTTYTCSACGHSYVGDIVKTSGHAYEGVVTAPTCTADGYTTYTCTACGDKYVGNKVTTSGHNYNSVVTAPTCKSDGYTTHTCTACGDKYVDSMVPTSGHSYESVVTPPTYNADGYTTHTCTACGHSYVNSIVPATGFTLAGANTVLGGVLDMNFFIKPSDLNGTDYYAVITLYAEDGVVTTTVPYDKWEVRSNYLVVTQKGLAARQMADKMEVVIYNGDGSQASFMWTDSIRGYVMRILEKQNAETKTMLVDMLNYGAAAQNFFEYNMDDLANNQFSDTQKAYATESVNCVNQQVKGENYFGSTLTLRDRIMLTMNFSNINPDMYAIVSFTDHKGVAHETRVEGSSFSKYNSTTYGVVVDELVVADGDQLVTVTVYDAAGNVVASASDSVNSYAARQMGKDALYEMVAKFTTSAYAHFH